jgi:GntR family transcriptional regulator
VSEGAGPLYLRVREALRARIEAGEWPPESPFPTDAELMAEYGVSRTTVREAVLALAQEGLLSRRQGRGTFIAAAKFVDELSALTGFTEEMESRRLSPRARVVSQETVVLERRQAELLGLPAGSPAYRIVRLRLVRDVPLEIETAVLPLDLGLRLLQANLEEEGYYPLLEQRHGIRISEAEETIEARLASADEARLLGLQRGAAVIVRERVTWDESGRAVALAHCVVRADRFKYRIRRRRQARSHA